MKEQKIRKKLTDVRNKVWIKEYNKALKERMEKTCKSLLPVYLLHFIDHNEYSLVSHIEEIKDIDRLTECSSDYYRMFDTYEDAYKRVLEIFDDRIEDINTSIKNLKDELKFLKDSKQKYKENKE